MTPFILVGSIELENSENALKERIGVSSLEYAQLVADRINEYLYYRYQDTKIWATADIILEFLSFDENSNLSRYLSEVKEHYKDYYYVICLNDKGQVIASSDQGIIGTHLSSEKGFWEAMNGNSYIQDVEYNRVALGYTIVFYVPVKSNSGKVVGVLSSALKWSKVHEMVYKLQIRGKEQDVRNHIMVTNKDGLIISCFNPHEMFRDNLIQLGMNSAKYASKG
ncbi:MAG: cache domain-containing protein, partial [Candidatus Tectomicrobia bacterium]|nr:cache domain-containing protein [Candidatus Tectomicrobia bacterium]